MGAGGLRGPKVTTITPSQKITNVKTTAFEGMKPGTSGLRKATKVFMQPNYTENFIQSALLAIPNNGVKGSTLLIGGDGRYFCKEAMQKIVKMCAANGVEAHFC